MTKRRRTIPYRAKSSVSLLLVATAIAFPARLRAQEIVASSAVLAPELTVVLVTAPFLENEHEMRADSDGRLVVDGCTAFYGTDNMEPGAYLKEASVQLEGVWHALDTSCMYACHFCSFEASSMKARPNSGGAGYVVDGLFSDGAGTYYASWLVTPTGTARTRIIAGPAVTEMSILDVEPRDERIPRILPGILQGIIDELHDFRTYLQDNDLSPADFEWIREVLTLVQSRPTVN